MEWARKSAPITAPPSNTSASGVCLSTAGAEEFGDMYFFNLFDSNVDSLSGDYYSPEIAAEIAKIAVSCTGGSCHKSPENIILIPPNGRGSFWRFALR